MSIVFARSISQLFGYGRLTIFSASYGIKYLCIETCGVNFVTTRLTCQPQRFLSIRKMICNGSAV